MDQLKGAHAAGTFLIVLSLLFFTYDWIKNYLNTMNDTLIGYLLWGSYAIISIMGLLVMPYIIATKGDAQGSILSVMVSFGMWAFGIIANMLLYPFFNIFTDSTQGFITPAMEGGNIMLQVLSFGYLLILFLSCYLLPVLMAISPHFFSDFIKEHTGL